MSTPNEIRSRIAGQTIAALGDPAKLPPWRRSGSGDPNGGHRCNVVRQRRCTGIDPLPLETAARRHGLPSKWRGPSRQWEERGARVRKRPAAVPPGQRGRQIAFCKPDSKRRPTASTARPAGSWPYRTPAGRA